MTSSAKRRRVWQQLWLALASLVAACTLDASNKSRCASDSDCLGGYVCEQSVCTRPTFETAGTSGTSGGAAGSAGTGGGAIGGVGGGAGGSIAGSSGGGTAGSIGGSGGDAGSIGGRTATGGAAGTMGAAGASGTGGGATTGAGDGGTGGGDTTGTGGGGTGGSDTTGSGGGGTAGTGGGGNGGSGGVATMGTGDAGGSESAGAGGGGGTGGSGNGGSAGAGGDGTGGGTGGSGNGGSAGASGSGNGGSAGAGGEGTGGGTGGSGDGRVAGAGAGGGGGGTGGWGGGATTGTGGGGGPGGSGGSSLCASAVTTCPTPTVDRCDETFCGGRLWRQWNSSLAELIPYRILDPGGKFTAAYRNAIEASAAAWSDATSGLVKFEKCTACVGRFVSIVPGEGDGTPVPSLWEQVVPLPVDADSLANIPLHRIAHQWGHVLGLGHTYERADRDRYVRFEPTTWCGPQGPGLPPRCALGPDEVGSPRIPSDTFGAYDERSKMNGFESAGICGSSEPDRNSGEPTAGDAAAVEELFFSQTSSWAPFQPLGRSISPKQPLDFQLAPGVDPTGTPAITTWTAPAVEIFARGTDGGVYGMHSEIASTVFQRWSDWQLVGIGVDADPAVSFADADTLHLVVRRSDATIQLRTRTQGGWGPWAPLGAPPGGAASAPALAVRDNQSLDVVVLGGDGFLYHMACTDPASRCTASAARTDAWAPLPQLSAGTIVGNPSADWTWSGTWLLVTAVTSDARAWAIGGEYANFEPSAWTWIPFDLDPTDPQPQVPTRFVGDSMGFYARNARHALINGDLGFVYPPLGGVLAAAPGVVIARHGVSRIDVAALIEDHGRPGIWWKFFSGDGGYTPPCNYNVPGTCAQCGCNVSNAPACFL